MPWVCTGSDHLNFSDIEAAIVHQRTFPDHVVEERPEHDLVGVADYGFVTLRGPDGKIKDVVGLN